MKRGDLIGGRYEIVSDGPIAVQGGGPDCHDVRCTRRTDTNECVGWHCPTCGAPCSSQGHRCPERDES